MINAIKKLRECIDLIVMCTSGKGCNLELEILEPRRNEWQIYASTFDTRRVPAQAHDFVSLGLDRNHRNPLMLQLLNE